METVVAWSRRRLGLGCFALLLLVGIPRVAEARGAPWLTGESRPEDLSVFLMTFSPGSDVPSWFGHGALGVEDPVRRLSALYNYGMFTFDETMLLRFVMGRLWFWVGEASVGWTVQAYAQENRSVRMLKFNLAPAKAAELAKALATNALPENRHYYYHHYHDNCSTRLRDMVDKAVDGQLKTALSTPARMTLRQHTERYTSVNVAMSLLLDYWMNDEIDKPILRWDEAFLPDELEAQLLEFHYRNDAGEEVPLVAKNTSLHGTTRPPTPAEVPVDWYWMLLAGVTIGGLAVLLSGWPLGLYTSLTGIVLGLPGLALALMWAFTEHTVTWRNENILLANPLNLLALPLGIAVMRGSPRAVTWMRNIWMTLVVTGVLGILLKVLPLFDQNNGRVIAFILPISMGFAASYERWRRRKIAALGSTL